VRLADLTREIAGDFLLWRLDLVEELLHQVIVEIGQLFEHMVARGALILCNLPLQRDHFRLIVRTIGVCALKHQIHEACDHPLLPDRKLARQQRTFTHALQRAEQRIKAAAGLIDLVDEQKGWNFRVAQALQIGLQLKDF